MKCPRWIEDSSVQVLAEFQIDADTDCAEFFLNWKTSYRHVNWYSAAEKGLEGWHLVRVHGADVVAPVFLRRGTEDCDPAVGMLRWLGRRYVTRRIKDTASPDRGSGIRPWGESCGECRLRWTIRFILR